MTDPKRHTPRGRRERTLLAVLISVSGIGLAYCSWLFQDVDAWWSATLGNVAVAVLLLLPAELAINWVRTGFRQVTAVSENARAVALEAKGTADQTAHSLADIEERLVSAQGAELNAAQDVYRRMKLDASRDSLLTALQQATADGLITSEGVRSPVWETDLHYRYVVDGPNGELEIRLEEDDGSVVSTAVWNDDEPAGPFYQRLVLAVREAGRDLGTGLNVPTQSVGALSEMLVDVVGLRSQVLAGNRSALMKIIERVDGWYFTERAVIPGEHLSYRIDVRRLDELDWEEHLRGKGWHESHHLIPFARRLYGTSTTT